MGDRTVVELSAAALAKVPEALAALLPLKANHRQSAFELAYLAASADGLDRAEQKALAEVLERATGGKVDNQAFADHFSDLEEGVLMLGRRERLARTAAEFETDDVRENAIRFAALVAMAEGKLDEKEIAVLAEAATHFEWTAERARELALEAADRVRGK